MQGQYRTSLFVLICAAVLLIAAGGARADDRQDALAWAVQNAKPLTSVDSNARTGDLKALADVVGIARVVSFGEAIHGGHEFLALRNRLFEYFVETQGFTAIVVETGFADSTAIDDYIMGQGELSPALVAGAFSFASPRAADENRALIEWMRAYNMRPGVKRKLHYYGLDMISRPSSRARNEASRTVKLALDYVAGVAPAEAERLKPRLLPTFAKIDSGPYEALSVAEKDALTVAVADLVNLFEHRHIDWMAATSALAYQRAYRHALNARNLDADFRVGGYWMENWDGDTNQRDAAQADLLRWALEREGAKSRVFLFAYNGHVRTGPFAVTVSKFTSMGQHLKDALGPDIVTIGTVYGSKQGFPPAQNPLALDPASVNILLADVGRPLFLLDLRKLPAGRAARRWWDQTRTLQSPEFINQLNPVDCFDALIFVDHATPALRFN